MCAHRGQCREAVCLLRKVGVKHWKAQKRELLALDLYWFEANLFFKSLLVQRWLLFFKNYFSLTREASATSTSTGRPRQAVPTKKGT